MKKRYIFIFGILIIALFLRLNHIAERTEFLGDQGSSGVVVYEAFKNRTLPLVGPAVSTGQRPGPFYYYLIAIPLIVTNFNPVAPAVLMSILGVLATVVIGYLGIKLFNIWIGYLIALLYTTSPLIVINDRNSWNPAPIPALVALLNLCFYQIYKGQRKYILFVAFIDGLLIQLHYSNAVTIFITLVFFIILFIREKKQRSKLLGLFFLGLIAFVLPLIPFIIYQFQNSFNDLRELILLVLTKPSSVLPMKAGPGLFELSARVFWYLIPTGDTKLMVLLQSVILFLPLVRPNFWQIFLVFWYAIGIFAISRYSGPIHDHYLFFLIPLPFFLLGACINFLKNYTAWWLGLVLAVIVIFLQLSRFDLMNKATWDIPRTSKAVDMLLGEAKGENFSFTLTSSRSFSDYHYRYFFRIREIWPKPIESLDYQLLFLICDKSPCITREELEKTKSISVLCYDHHCRDFYPNLDLSPWRIENVIDIDGASRLFKLRHK